MRHPLIALALLCTLTACADDGPAAAPAATVTVTATAQPTPTTQPTQPGRFPKGYPRVVRVSSLPFQVRSWYQKEGHAKAVAIAPGVWTPLSPGSTVQDAIAAGNLAGFCASIDAYERKYTPGESNMKVCW